MKRIIVLGLILVCVSLISILGNAAAVNLTVSSTVMGKTPEYLGTVEGGFWNVADLVDCGMKSVRLYCDMTRIEPTDDDGAYGTPTIAQVKANPNIIPWTLWDQRMNDASLWGTGVSLAQIFADCAANGIQPLICIRTWDINHQPAWAPLPPFDDTNPNAKNELWEFCFALAYWCNVRHNYGFFEWQSYNEPDRASQGWTGTEAQYAEFCKVLDDAVHYANGLASPVVPVWNHVGNSPGWGPLDAVLLNADPQSDVVDYHYYRSSQTSQAQNAYGRIGVAGQNSDGIVEPLWNSEWGTYQGSYGSVSMGMSVADDLYEFACFDAAVPDHCRGTSIFVMWDWGTAYDGLVNAGGSRNSTYWAHRLMNRAVNGYKDRMTTSGEGRNKIIVTRDAAKVYIVAVGCSSVINVNLSALGVPNGTATLYYYGTGYNDVVVGNPAVSNGQVSFTGLSGGVSLLVVNR
jgi:hypothetical protein